MSGEIPQCTLYISIVKLLGFYGKQRQIYLYLRDSQKMISCHYILSDGIFHVFYLFCFFCPIMTHPNRRTIIELRHEGRIH